MDKKIMESDALKANIQQAKDVQILIPDEHLWLLSLSEHNSSVHERSEEFFREYHHPYANKKLVIDLFSTFVIKDFWIFSSRKKEERHRIISDIYDIFDTLLQEQLPKNLGKRLISVFLDFFDGNAAEDGFRHDFTGEFIGILEKNLEGNRIAFLSNIGHFRTVMRQISRNGESSAAAFAFQHRLIAGNIAFWKATTRLDEWYGKNREKMTRDYSGQILPMGDAFYDGWQAQLDAAADWDGLCAISYSFSDLINQYRNMTAVFQTVPEQLRWLFYLMHLPGAEHFQEYLLIELNKAIRRVGTELDEPDCKAMMEELFRFFADFKESHLSLILDSILALGKEILQTGNLRLIHYLEDRMIGFGFITPGSASQTDEWTLEINPCHIKNVRVWLELIEYNPEVMQKLLSALIIHLKLGGIFIFDTDFFQKDITRLLNSHISPLYKQIKALTRNFPVFFNEIGAEGPLRNVSTTLDETSHRNDKLIHFLRKQIHIEGNNLHISITRDVARFWYDLKLERLKDEVPDNVYRTINPKGEWVKGVHQVMKELCRISGLDVDRLLEARMEEVNGWLGRISHPHSNDILRVGKLIELYQLLKEKYVYDTTDISLILGRYPFIGKEDAARLKDLMDREDHLGALKMIYSFMFKSNGIIFNPKKSEGVEHIFYKRHVVFGIPSVYGSYHEDKFDALGLIFRLERIASLLIGKIISGINTEYFSLKTLRELYQVLDYLREGLRLDGIVNQGFDSHLQMLQYSLNSGCFTIRQYINIFQFLETSLKEITHTYFIGPYENLLRIIVPQYLTPEQQADEKTLNKNILLKSEIFYRDLLSSAFIIQTLDNLIGVILNNLRKQVEMLSEPEIQSIMSYNQDLVSCRLHEENPSVDNPVFIGAKAYYLKKLALKGYPIPPGFVLTTEVFRRIRTILKVPALNHEIEQLIRSNIARLEKETGLEFGNPEHLLLLSVRSGSAISMPGAMNTFLNVGLNDAITEQWSRQPNFAWTSWDCYRRLLQTWGMSFGIDRNEFGRIMQAFKKKYNTSQKIEFTAGVMREIAYAYKRLLEEHGIPFEQDPFRQLKQAVVAVFNSWDTPRAKVYRKHMQIANEWGTAVIAQKMIFGNMYDNSGSGVLFTHDNQDQESGVELNGDFSYLSQGEDIVGGLVNTLPISEKQRLNHYRNCPFSLESTFPKIYRRMDEIAHRLIERDDFLHQEIEFTFETDRPEDLYILQTRRMNTLKSNATEVFDTAAQPMLRAGSGIGIGSRMLNGRLVFDLDDLAALKQQYPDENAVLVRPDTVPDDIGIIFECEGLLTAKGGATSHAAVTAAALGKICVVNCSDMMVYEDKKECVIGEYTFRVFDRVAVDGINGVFYKGNYPIRIQEL